MPVLAPSPLPRDTHVSARRERSPHPAHLRHHHGLQTAMGFDLEFENEGAEAAAATATAPQLSRYRALNRSPAPPSSSCQNQKQRRPWLSPPAHTSTSPASLRGLPIKMGIDLHASEQTTSAIDTAATATATPCRNGRKQQQSTPLTPSPSTNELRRSCHALQAFMINAGLIRVEDTLRLPTATANNNPRKSQAAAQPLLPALDFLPNRTNCKNDTTDPYLRAYTHPSKREQQQQRRGSELVYEKENWMPMMAGSATPSPEIEQDGFPTAAVNVNKRAWMEFADDEEDEDQQGESGARVWSHGSSVQQGRRKMVPRSPYGLATGRKGGSRAAGAAMFSTPPRQSKAGNLPGEHIPWGLDRWDFMSLDAAVSPFSSSASPASRSSTRDGEEVCGGLARAADAIPSWSVHDGVASSATTAPRATTTTAAAAGAMANTIKSDSDDEDTHPVDFLHDTELFGGSTSRVSRHRELSFSYESGSGLAAGAKSESRRPSKKLRGMTIDSTAGKGQRQAVQSPEYLEFSF